LFHDFVLLARKLEELGFLYGQGKVLIAELSAEEETYA